MRKRNIVRCLRKRQTAAEASFWNRVRNRKFMGLKIRRQHPVGKYIADFYCPQYRLVMEIDGSIHQLLEEDDKIKAKWYAENNYHLVRFSNEQVLHEPESVLQYIRNKIESIQELNSSPSPYMERGSGGEV